MPANGSTDEFLDAARQLFDNIGKHSRKVMVGLVLLLIAGVAGAAYLNHRESKLEAGREALFLAHQELEKELNRAFPKPVASPAPTAKTQQESNAHKRFDVDAQLPETVKKLKAIASTYLGTRIAFESELTLADLYYDHGDSLKAVNWYQAAVASAPGLLEKSLALYGLGFSYENSGKPKEAITTYEKAVNLGQIEIKGDLLLAIARCYEILHDSVKARSTYDQILTQLPNSEFARSAELYKSQI